MRDVHPYPQNITADPFFVYGGLFSRKIIEEELSKLKGSAPRLFSSILNDSERCRDEIALHSALEKTFNDNGILCKKTDSLNPNCDRLLGNSFIVEVKISNYYDPQFWNGSRSGENSIEQTRRYLDECKQRRWAILTNGKVIRLMHKDCSFRFFEIWICDSNRHGETAQATFFEKLLADEEYLESIYRRSNEEVDRFTTIFETGAVHFWENNKKPGNRPYNVALVETVLMIAFYRYLEDIGVLPVNSREYDDYNLQSLRNKVDIVKSLRSLQSQTFITRTPMKAHGLIEDHVLQNIETILGDNRLLSQVQNLFWKDKKSIDLSDLKVSFFGDAYQLFANKNDVNGAEGQYFTGSELAKDSALFFVEEEKRGLHGDEIIYDPFVGSGQLLRALVPFFHILVQTEERSNSIVNGMRILASRFAGTDIDPNACWLARLSLTISTAEKGKPFIDFSHQIKQADVFATCFGYTESRWQEQLGIRGTIKGIITNPPWRRLRQTTNELYTMETSNPAPLKANKENWKLYQEWLKKGGKQRAEKIGTELKKIAKEHRETFKRTGQREVNLAVSAVDFIDRIQGSASKKWICFLPDAFFIGENKMRRDKAINLRKYYSYPYNDHFKDTDSVMKFGIMFGGGSKNDSLFCHPMGKGKVNIKSVFKSLGVLPIYESTSEAIAQKIWFEHSERTNLWHRGEFDESMLPKKGAVESSQGKYVRGAKKCNNTKTYRCDFNSESLSKWSKWKSKANGKSSRVIVRDNRSNTRNMKILWAGIHIPGEDGIPKECHISNAWNYIVCEKDDAKWLFTLMNSPIADLAMRSIASKRHVNPKDLNRLGLPRVTESIKKMVVASSGNYELANSIIFKLVFRMDNDSIETLVNNCDWLSKESKDKIIQYCSKDLATVLSEFKTKKSYGGLEKKKGSTKPRKVG